MSHSPRRHGDTEKTNSKARLEFTEVAEVTERISLDQAFGLWARTAMVEMAGRLVTPAVEEGFARAVTGEGKNGISPRRHRGAEENKSKSKPEGADVAEGAEG